MSLHPAISKTLAVTILALLVVASVVVALPVVQQYQSNAEEIATLRQSLGRFQAIADYREKLTGQDGTVEPEFVQRWFLAKGLPAIITADLQSRLKTIASTNGAQIVAANELKPRVVDGMTYLGVRVNVKGSFAGVHKTIRAIETGVPYLFVENAAFRADPVLQRASTPDAQIEVQLEISGAQMSDTGQSESGS